MAELYTSSERFQRAISAAEIDRVPVVPLISLWTARNCGYDSKQLFQVPEILARAHIKSYESIGCDSIMSTCDSLYFVEALGCETELKPGAVLETKKYVKVETDEDLLNLKEVDPYRDGRLPIILEAVRLIASYAQGRAPVMAHCNGPFSAAGRLMGVENLLMAMLDRPELIKRLLEKLTPMLCRYAEALVHSGVDFFFIPDPVSSSSVISPQHYAEFSLPYARRLIESIPKPAMLHICGRTTGILGQMMKTGAAILSLDECMDLRQVRDMVGEKIAIGGNVDPVNIIMKGSREEVIKAAFRCIESAGEKKFLLMAGCTIPPDAPLDNLKAMVEASRNYA